MPVKDWFIVMEYEKYDLSCKTVQLLLVPYLVASMPSSAIRFV